MEWNEAIEVNDEIMLCIALDEGIEESDLFTHYELGKVVKNSDSGVSVHRFQPNRRAYLNDGKICANISDPGTYIGIKVRDSDYDYDSLLAQCIVASVFYWALLAGTQLRN